VIEMYQPILTVENQVSVLGSVSISSGHEVIWAQNIARPIRHRMSVGRETVQFAMALRRQRVVISTPELPAVFPSGGGLAALGLGALGQGFVERFGSVEAALLLAAEASGVSLRSGAGEADLLLNAQAVGEAPALAGAEGSGLAALLLNAEFVGVSVRSGSGDAPLGLDAQGVGVSVRSGSGVGDLILNAQAVGEAIEAASGSGLAPLLLGADGVGVSLRSGSGEGPLLLDAVFVGVSLRSGSGVGLVGLDAEAEGEALVALGQYRRPGGIHNYFRPDGSSLYLRVPTFSGSGAAGLLLDADGVGATITSGSGEAPLLLDSDGVGSSPVSGFGEAELLLDADGVGSSPVSGVAEAPLLLDADGVGVSVRSGSGEAPLLLDAQGVGSSPVAGSGEAPLLLDADGVGVSVRSGSGESPLLLAAEAEGETTPIAEYDDTELFNDLFAPLFISIFEITLVSSGSGTAEIVLTSEGAGAKLSFGAGDAELLLGAAAVGEAPAVGVPEGSGVADLGLDAEAVGNAPIEFIGAASANTTTVSLPSGTAAGDFAIVVAGRTATAGPSIPSGWNDLGVQAGGSGGTAHGQRVGWKILVAADITAGNVGTWTSAAQIGVSIYRGATGVGGNSSTGANSTVVSFPARGSPLTAGSWVVAVGSHRNAGNLNDRTLSSFTNRTSGATSTNIGIWDTNGVVSSTSAGTVTVTNSSGNAGRTVEILN
jgi:hypothetical protein